MSWRENLDTIRLLAELLEVERRRWPELPLEVVAYWAHDVHLCWHTSGLTLQEWAENVRRASAVLGPPQRISPTVDSERPELCAAWDRKHHQSLRVNPWGGVSGYHVYVRNFNSKGCRLDPRKPLVERENGELHPECLGALEQLRDEVQA